MTKRKLVDDDDLDVALETIRSKKYKWDTPVFSETLSKMQVEAPKKRVPKHEWFNAKSPEDQKKWVEQQLAKTSKRKSGRRTAYKRRRTSYGRGGSGRGTNIIYPNVIGRGEYYLGGGFGYDPKEGWYGHAKGHITDTVQGLGGYSVRTNSLMSAIDLGQDPPRVANTNRGEATIINHREYLGDLFSGLMSNGTSTSFNLMKYSLNPGNQELFPFLSSIARNFQEYEIRGMLVELKSLSSEYSSNIALGSVFMAADYNVYGNDPTTKQQVENMEYASSAKPSKSMIMPIECDPSNNAGTHKNVAIDSAYNGGDRRLYDWCTIYIGSQGIPAEETPLAEIWLTYEIALFKPIIGNNESNHPTGVWDAASFQFVNVTDDHPGGNIVVPNPTNTPGYGVRYTGSVEESIYIQCIIDLPDLQAGHQPIYLKVDFYVSQGDITGPPVSLAPSDISCNGAVEHVAGTFPDNGIASASNSYRVGQHFGLTRSENVSSFIFKRTGANTGGGKSQASLQISSAILSAAGQSRGLLMISSLPGTYNPVF